MRLWADTGANVVNNGMTLQLLNGVPRQVTVWATPFEFYENLNQNWAAFVQDQWTIKRATINAGLRFDHLEDMVPAQTLGPGPQVPNRSISFAEVTGVPDWTNVTPRFGIAYDVFGTGKTAVKFNIGKYLAAPNPITLHANRQSGRRPGPERHENLERRERQLRAGGERARSVERAQLRHDGHRARSTHRMR